MNIIITMAGLSSRFAAAGYTIPKYELTANGLTLFEWSILSLQDFFNEEWIFIALRQNRAADFIKQKAEKWINRYSIIELDQVTDGQATTVLEVSNCIERECPIIIYNIDTHINPICIKKKDIRGDGFVPLFIAEGNKWSFAKINSKFEIVGIAEKERISTYATLGFYYFNTFDLYKLLYKKTYVENSPINSEKYIAPIYQVAIELGYKIMSIVIDSKDIIPLGTPEDLRSFIKKRPTSSLKSF